MVDDRGLEDRHCFKANRWDKHIPLWKKMLYSDHEDNLEMVVPDDLLPTTMSAVITSTLPRMRKYTKKLRIVSATWQKVCICNGALFEWDTQYEGNLR